MSAKGAEVLERQLAAAARGESRCRILQDAEPVCDLGWREVYSRACTAAQSLADCPDLRPGGRIALAMPLGIEFVVAVQACWLAGLCVTVVPSSDGVPSERYLRELGFDAMLGSDDPARFTGGIPTYSIERLIRRTSHESRYEGPMAVDPRLPAVMQLTSGSTGAPRAVVISREELASHCQIVAKALGATSSDIFASWLPLHHDMGFIGMFSTAMLTGASVNLMDVRSFVSRPARWLEMISDHKSTVTAGPNVAFAMATRVLKQGGNLDLSSLRVAANGGEMVSLEVCRDFLAAGKKFGLSPDAIRMGYGLAEATLLVALSDEELPRIRVSRTALSTGLVRSPHSDHDSQDLPLLGAPVVDCEARIWDARDSAPAPLGHVGSIQIQKRGAPNKIWHNGRLRSAAGEDGWIDTGDLGFISNGQLVVCGRTSEVIIVGGVNLYPEDVEAAATSNGTWPGRAAAFGIRTGANTDGIALVKELSDKVDPAEYVQVKRDLSDTVYSLIGHRPRAIRLVPSGTIPRTSSGKLRRREIKSRFEDGTL